MTVTFEFIGGPHDGLMAKGNLGDGGGADRCYPFKGNGIVGLVLKMASEYLIYLLVSEGPGALQRHNRPKHFYLVSERIDEYTEGSLRAEYMTNTAHSAA